MTSHMEVMQLCRLCLEKEQVNVQIFEDSDIERQVHHKISTCLPVKVEKEDILPKKICDGCMYKLDILYEFWTTCANAETQLNEWLQESEFAVTEEEAEIDTKHEALCHGEEETLEEVAEIAQDALEEEVVSEPPPKRIKKIAENNEIGIELMTVAKTEVESDEEQAEETVYEEQPIDVPGPSGISQTDTKCSSTIQDLYNKYKRAYQLKNCVVLLGDLKSYDWTTYTLVKNQSAGPLPRFKYKCNTCNDRFINYELLAMHRKDAHGSSDLDDGGEEVPQKKRRRLSSSEDEEFLMCKYCDKVYHDSTIYNEHMKLHKTNDCVKCKQRFTAKTDLYDHLKYMHSLFPCSKCKYILRKQTHLDRHLFEKHGILSDLVQTCKDCNIKFADKHSFLVHRRKVHYVTCDICKKKFSTITLLNVHKTCHKMMSTSLHGCTKCSLEFKSPKDLKEHSDKVHSNHKCRLCNLIYPSVDELENHYTTHMTYLKDDSKSKSSKEPTILNNILPISGVMQTQNPLVTTTSQQSLLIVNQDPVTKNTNTEAPIFTPVNQSPIVTVLQDPPILSQPQSTPLLIGGQKLVMLDDKRFIVLPANVQEGATIKIIPQIQQTNQTTIPSSFCTTMPIISQALQTSAIQPINQTIVMHNSHPVANIRITNNTVKLPPPPPLNVIPSAVNIAPKPVLVKSDNNSDQTSNKNKQQTEPTKNTSQNIEIQKDNLTKTTDVGTSGGSNFKPKIFLKPLSQLLEKSNTDATASAESPAAKIVIEKVVSETPDTSSSTSVKQYPPQSGSSKKAPDVKNKGKTKKACLNQTGAENKNDAEKSVRCKFCPVVCRSQSKMMTHLNKYKCKVCDFTACRMRLIDNHYEGKHGFQNRCTSCDLQFGTAEELQVHKTLVHHCVQCNRFFLDIDKHRNKFTCLRCNYSACTSCTLDKHYKEVHNVTTRCAPCNMAFYSKESFIKHKDDIHFCNKCQLYKMDLNVHQTFCKGKKPEAVQSVNEVIELEDSD